MNDQMTQQAEELIEELAALTPPDTIATCDTEGVADILTELRSEPCWLHALPELAVAVRGYVRMRRAAVGVLLAQRISARCDDPARRARCSTIQRGAESRWLARNDVYRRQLDALACAASREIRAISPLPEI